MWVSYKLGGTCVNFNKYSLRSFLRETSESTIVNVFGQIFQPDARVDPNFSYK